MACGLARTPPHECREGERRPDVRSLDDSRIAGRLQWAGLALSLVPAAGLWWIWCFELGADHAFRSFVEAHLSTLLPLAGLCATLVPGAVLFGISARERTLRRVVELGAELERECAARRELERFACTVSHDLKTPLLRTGFLLSYLEEDLEPVLRGPGADPDAAPDATDHLARMRAQVHRMGDLIDGVLEYSAGGTGTMPVESVDTRAVFEEIAEGLELPAERLVLDGAMPTLDTWRTPFVQVMANLVGNACKYHPRPREAIVTVRVARLGERWRFSVADDGAGIDPRFHDRIFEMFQTLEHDRPVDSTGVGLAIVRKCVESVGGAVRVDSAPGGGASFRVDWPMTVPDVPAPPSALRAA